MIFSFPRFAVAESDLKMSYAYFSLFGMIQ